MKSRAKQFFFALIAWPLLAIAEAPLIDFVNDGQTRWLCVEVIEGEDIVITRHAIKEKVLGCVATNDIQFPGRVFRAVSTERIRAVINRSAFAQILIGTQDNSEADIPPEGSPPATHFTSDAVIWPDIGTELGEVPNAYANYQMVQSAALDINRDTADYGFTLDGATTLVYVHITSNAHATYKPAWLTAGNGWSYSGNIGTVVVPDSLTQSGTREVAGYYYENSVGSGAYTHAGYRAAAHADRLSHFVGTFLVASGVTISSPVPTYRDVVSDISDAYTAPAITDIWYDITPDTTYDESATAATSWADLETKIEAASCGDYIELNDATYNDDGLADIDDVACTLVNPVTVRPQSRGGAIISGTTRLQFDNSDGIVWEGFDFDGVDSGVSFGSIIRCLSDSSQIVVRNNAFRNYQTTNDDNFGVRIDCPYFRLHNNFIDNVTEDRQFIVVEGQDVDDLYFSIDHNWIEDYNPGTSSGTGEAIQAGNDQTQATVPEHNGSVVANYILRWDGDGNNDETEVIGVKGGGTIVAGNVIEDSNGIISARLSCDHFFAFNVFLNDTLKRNRNMSGSIQGCGEDRGDQIHARNYVDYFSHPNGWHAFWRVDSTTGTRRASTNTLIVGELVVNGNDQPLYTTTSGSSNLVKTMNAVSECVAFNVSSSLTNFGDHTLDASVTWSGSVMNGGSDPSISGVTFASPGFSDRGDGIQTPSNGSLDCGTNIDFPGWLTLLPKTSTAGKNW